METKIDNAVTAAASSADPLLAAKSPEPAAEADQRAPRFAPLLVAAGRSALLAFIGYTFVRAACRVRRDPGELAFVAGSYALIGALLLCLRRAERLAPDSLASERRAVQAAVWALTAVLSAAFACRVAALVPPPLAALVWAATASVVLVGLYMLVLVHREDQHYHVLHDCEAAIDCDAKALTKKVKSGVQMAL